MVTTMTVMEKAYDVAAHAVRRRLAEQHPDDLRVLDDLGRGQVAVFKGSFDRVEHILDRLRILFRHNPGRRGLMASTIAFVNCSGRYKPARLRQLADFVAQGGWLVTSDWALGLVIEQIFPGTVRRAPGHTRDEVISVEPMRDSLWDAVVVLGADPQWWCENSSHLIDVVDPARVRIEAASHDLLQRHGAPAVAVAFDWETGRVFHVTSHFWCTRSRAPTDRHRGPSVDFLKAGMGLSDDDIAGAFRAARVEPASLNFAQIQSAATATELVAQLCIRAARRRNTQPRPEASGLLRRLRRLPGVSAS